MQLAIRDYRRMLLFRGIIAVLLGILILVWPRIALAVLVYLFGALVLVGGIIAVATALRYTHEEGWALLLVEGILGIVAGVVAFAWPGITFLFFVFLIAGSAAAAAVSRTRESGRTGGTVGLGPAQKSCRWGSDKKEPHVTIRALFFLLFPLLFCPPHRPFFFPQAPTNVPIPPPLTLATP